MEKTPCVCVMFPFFLFIFCRKTQSDSHTNQTSIQGAEEGVCNISVLAKQESCDGKKHFSQRLNKKKKVKAIQQNPYRTPEAQIPVTGIESSNMMEQMRENAYFPSFTAVY